MKDNKSYAEFVLGSFDAMLKDCALQYPALAKEFQRDYTRLSSAIISHGVRFALDVMPAWRKHFDRCLASGRLTRSHMQHFSCWKKEGTVPRLFRGLVLRVFDLDGVIKPEPDVQAIRMLRQLLGAFKRMRMDCGPKARSDAVKDFIRTDLDVGLGTLPWGSDSDFDSSQAGALSFTDSVPTNAESEQGTLPGIEVSSLAYGHARCIQQVADYISANLGHFDPLDTRFRHGPGAVSDQDFGSFKYDFQSWPERLESVFPMADFACANYASWEDTSLYRLSEQEINQEFPAQLCAVPKTIKTPRLIACEPTSFQWCQQSVRDFLYKRVSRTPIGLFIDFRQQELNGDLALAASRAGSHCTIDLSSASDRVSCWHVERLFRRSPSLLQALWASRSRWIGQDICRFSPQLYKLRKFSTMGNATTFPVQSLFFLSVALGTLCYIRGQRVSGRLISSLGSGEVRVFGDDIIVPEDCAVGVVDALHALGLKVNNDKTFLTGLFRESCGVDAFAGQNVTSAGVMETPNRSKPGSIVSSVDVHNNLAMRGMYSICAYIRKTVEQLGLKHFQVVEHGSGSFGWLRTYDMGDTTYKRRTHPSRHCPQAYVYRIKTNARMVPSEGTAALLQYFTEVSEEVTSAVSTLVHPERRAKVTLDLGWVDLR